MPIKAMSGLAYHPNQATLFLVDPNVQIEQKQSWEVAVEKAAKLTLKREISAKKRLEILVVEASNQGFSWINDQSLRRFLDMPLNRHVPSDLDVQPASESDSTDEATLAGLDKIEWIDDLKSDNAIRLLHEAVLNYSLQLLNSKGNAKEKQEVLNWIWSEDVYAFRTKKFGRKTVTVPIRRDQMPFTFQTCCRLSGCCYDELREGLAWTLRDAFQRIGFTPKKT